MATNFNGTSKDWVQGDFNYDGSVDLTDFTFLASNFNFSVPAAGLGAQVPEPSAVLVAASAVLASRSRRKILAALA